MRPTFECYLLELDESGIKFETLLYLVVLTESTFFSVID